MSKKAQSSDDPKYRHRFIFFMSGLPGCVLTDALVGIKDLAGSGTGQQLSVLRQAVLQAAWYISSRATEGRFSLIVDSKLIPLGILPVSEPSDSTSDYELYLQHIHWAITAREAAWVIEQAEMVFFVETDDDDHWDYNFIKVASGYGSSVHVLGLDPASGSVIQQEYLAEGRTGEGFIVGDEEGNIVTADHKRAGYLKFFQLPQRVAVPNSERLPNVYRELLEYQWNKLRKFEIDDGDGIYRTEAALSFIAHLQSLHKDDFNQRAGRYVIDGIDCIECNGNLDDCGDLTQLIKHAKEDDYQSFKDSDDYLSCLKMNMNEELAMGN
ncbi:MAG: hypothetical protein OXC05_00765 [Halieaceae bacterium]|nr:hypothetical protein [Halieaceae bacterium]